MLKDEKTYKRVLRALVKAKQELYVKDEIELMLITTDKSEEIVFEDSQVKIINIFEWLLFK